jgi:hypothetical protein
MAEEHQKSRATRYLDQHPELRQTVLESPAFQQRLAALESKSLILDDEKLYFPWGDTPQGLDDLIFDEGVAMGVIELQAVYRELGDEGR